MYIFWPPAQAGFHVYGSELITGPPVLQGFLCTHHEASGLDKIPHLCRSMRWVFRAVGLPRCPHHRLQCRLTCTCMTAYSSPGLPLDRVSLARAMRPPAWTGFHVCLNPCGGSPALSGLPDVRSVASSIDRLLCVWQCDHLWASRFAGLSLHTQRGLRLRPTSMHV